MRRLWVGKISIGNMFPAYVVASILFLIVMPTLLGRIRNPPYHLYGGLDLERQAQGLLLAVVNLLVSVVFVRLRPDRRLLTVALTTLWSCVVLAYLAWYGMSRSFPPL